MPIKSNLQSLAPAREKFKKEIVLLSHGYSMPDKLPGGKVVVYPWDQSIDEWVMKALRKVPVEQISFEVVKKLINLDKVDSMPVGDVITILLVARALARDSSLNYDSKCPACGHVEPVKLQVPDNLEKVAEKPDNYPGWDEILLPVCGDKIKLRPLLVRDEITVLESPENPKVSKKMMRAVAALVAVNDTQPDSPDEAIQYFNALPPADFTYYADMMEKLTPHLGTEVKHKCEACSHEYSHDLNLDADFFR
jgi:hypothetical protein